MHQASLLPGSGRQTVEADFEGIADFKVEREALFPIMADCRAVRAVREYCTPLLLVAQDKSQQMYQELEFSAGAGEDAGGD